MNKIKVYETDGFSLYAFQDSRFCATHQKAPILITFALVNRADILDICPKRSFIQQLLKHHTAVFLIEWKEYHPDLPQKSLAQYISHDIHQAVKKTYEFTAQKVFLLGVCQGGYFNLCYSILNPTLLQGLILMVTPIDFHVANNRLYQLIKYVDLDQLILPLQSIPGWWITQGIYFANPFSITQKKLHLHQTALSYQEKQFAERVESWAWDCPNQSKQAFLEFAKVCIQENALVKGILKLADKKIRLSQLSLPTLNIVANRDPIWPVACQTALSHYIPSNLYEAYTHAGGHIGVMVSAKGLDSIPQRINQFVERHSIFNNI